MADFIITLHAKQRIEERFIWSKAKIQKLIKKAYASKLEVPVNRAYKTQDYPGRQIRNFLGYIWIFKDSRLITIIKI